ncbi:MAG: hypothetical protein ACXVZ2_13145 [Gaiellaceae bacterium]
MSAEPARIQLGELLVHKGVLTEEHLEIALAEQGQSGAPLGEILVRLGFAQGPTIANALAEQYGGPLRTEYGLAIGPTPTGPVSVPAVPDTRAEETAIMRLRQALDEKTEELARVYAELVQARQELDAHRAVAAPADRHLLFVPGPEGYTMVERAGPAPEAGTVVQHGTAAFTVRTVGDSTLLGVPMRCALLAAA